MNTFAEWKILDMPWTKPEHSRNQVNKAGDVISGRAALSDMDFDAAMDIAGNWRAAHGYPLYVMYGCLQRAAKKIDEHALTSKRQKRMPSIVAKLNRFTTAQSKMQLSNMQDLGGCRAVMPNVDMADKLVALYEGTNFEAFEHDSGKKKDYTATPKDDGYRSVHLIYKYRGESQCGAFKNLKIEVQIRSRLQHLWATALETIDAFTGQGLKSNVGEEPWKRFFVLVSGFMAGVEKRPTPLGFSGNGMIEEFCDLCQRLNVPDIFTGLSVAVQGVAQKQSETIPGVQSFLLRLDSQERRTYTTPFMTNKEAEAALLKIEKENADKPHIQIVMASADSLKALRQAYPSYYADTKQFVNFINNLKTLKKPQEK